nr:class I SAM-dependent methyltransferase [Arthrobacter polaris]
MAEQCIERFGGSETSVSVFQIEEELLDVGRQDLIICVNVFDHIEDIRSTLKTFRDLLDINGRLVLSIPHPLKNHGRWVKHQNETGRWIYDHYQLDDYLQEGVVFRDRENKRGDSIITKVRSHHRTMSTYYNDIVDAGFLVRHMYEPVPPANSSESFDAYYQQASRIPYFWVLDCIVN